MHNVKPAIAFDREYYVRLNPDLPETVDAAMHYRLYGWKENRNPAVDFDSRFYTTSYADFAAAGTSNPLEHYNTVGRFKGYSNLPENSEVLVNEASLSGGGASAAIHCHLSDLSLWPEICDTLFSVGPARTVFLAVASDADFAAAMRYAEKYPEAREFLKKFVVGKMRSPLQSLVEIARTHPDFDIWGHAYTRSDASVDDRVKRGYHLGQVFGSPHRIDTILQRMTAAEQIGFYFSEPLPLAKQFLAGILDKFWPERQPDDEYPEESFFWVRSVVIKSMVFTYPERWNSLTEDVQALSLLKTLLEKTLETGLQFKSFRSTLEVPSLLHRPAATAQQNFDQRGDRWWPSPLITRSRPLPLENPPGPINSNQIDLHWVIPDFTAGGGGHMTIFRFVSLLPSDKFRQTIWIQNSSNHRTPAEAKRQIVRWYQPISDDVIVRFLPDDVEEISGDAVIATDCFTAFPVSRMARFKERFYFIQDWETEFFPAGDSRLAAGLTYGMGFTALTAGAWLAEKAKAAGMQVVEWNLGADREHYHPKGSDQVSDRDFQPLQGEFNPDRYAARKTLTASARKGVPEMAQLQYTRNGFSFDPARDASDIPHIALYARGHTPRRAVELAMAGLKELASRGWLFHAHFFGEEKDFGELPFIYTPHGLCNASELNRIYEGCDVGMAFSSTNYSLVPLEMMVSGLCVLEIDTESTRAAYPEGAVIRAKPAAYAIADELAQLFSNAEARKRLAEAGSRFVEKLDWQDSVKLVGDAIASRVIAKAGRDVGPLIRELEARPAAPGLPSPGISNRPSVSIFIPTYNAGPDFDVVLQAIAEQQSSTPFELVIIDSGSTDETLDLVDRWSKHIRVNRSSITTAEFGHGRTRNQGIDISEGEYVAILTQDACPASPHWLENLVQGFGSGNRVAGVFGRHLAYPIHELFEGDGLKALFETFRLLGPVQSINGDLPSYVHPGSPSWQSALQFYSDNNSCIRKSVWRQVPYQDVPWGEDQVWAWEVVRLGFQKAYAHDAAVFHSHDYAAKKLMQVGAEEGRMFLRHFGMYIGLDEDRLQSSTDLLNMVRDRVAEDREKLAANGVVDDGLLLRRALQHLALQKGRSKGTTEEKRKSRR